VVQIIPVSEWPVNAVHDWKSRLRTNGWRQRWQDEKTFFIFDEAQLTYEDFGLWNDFFKSLRDYEQSIRNRLCELWQSNLSTYHTRYTILCLRLAESHVTPY
jgi:hypothetical protein